MSAEVTPARRRVLAALARAAIAPGEMLWAELIVRCRPTPVNVLAKVVHDLAGDGLVEADGNQMSDSVRLTSVGSELVDTLGLPWAVRT